MSINQSLRDVIIESLPGRRIPSGYEFTVNAVVEGIEDALSRSVSILRGTAGSMGLPDYLVTEVLLGAGLIDPEPEPEPEPEPGAKAAVQAAVQALADAVARL